ncbi:MAG: hypothetical protein ACLFSY_02165 [Desulfonatronovibrionaceae bacterium]
MSEKQFFAPVKPVNMELVFMYPCPNCGREVPLLASSEPGMARCDSCRKQFAITPVDKATIDYMRLILDNGRAAVDPDFV